MSKNTQVIENLLRETISVLKEGGGGGESEEIKQIAQAAEAYNVGKTQIAQAITSKGVETSPTETYPEMASKVAQIAQETTIYEGADSYGKQLFADNSLWDLYQVLADMKTRFIGTGDYAALIVCEYYKGYDSLFLQGADGYYTCDGDYYDYASSNHVWHDENNGKINRWVVFLYRDEGARYDITNTYASPRSMYIGGHIGTIEYFIDGRLTDLVCGIEETDVLDYFLNKKFNQAWGFNTILRGVKNVSNLNTKSSVLYIEMPIGSVANDALISDNNTASFIKIKGLTSATLQQNGSLINGYYDSVAEEIIAEDFETVSGSNARFYFLNQGSGSNKQSLIRRFYVPKFKEGKIIHCNSGTLSNLIDLYVGELKTSQSLPFWTAANILADATKKAQLIENIKNHILARVSDATGGAQLVFTVSTNMYNNIASEQIEWQDEMMSLADAFLTKNWLLAGA